jgi:hypothetical protein
MAGRGAAAAPETSAQPGLHRPYSDRKLAALADHLTAMNTLAAAISRGQAG